MGENQTFVIYMATNTVNGKRYVGATTRGFEARKSEHRWAIKGNKTNCPIFYAAARKYGEHSFEWSIIATVKSESKLMAEEIRLIAELKPEYNVTRGGDGVVGVPRTAEWRANQSKALMGRVGTRYWLGKRHVQTTKDKISRSKKGQRPDKSIATLHKHRAVALDEAAKKCGYPVICLNDDMYFDCLGFASRHYGLGLSASQINNSHVKIRRGRPIQDKLFAYADGLHQ